MKTEDYDVIILAAGEGRRIRELTTNTPKSLLKIGDKRIIEHTLELLNEQGFKRAIIVVGYKKEAYRKTLGDLYKNIEITYVNMKDYATTEHGWSFYQTKKAWQEHKRNVLFFDADMIFDPTLLEDILKNKQENICMTDRTSQGRKDTTEEYVQGKNGKIQGFKREIGKNVTNNIGEFVGINKFSSEHMQSLYSHMDKFFTKHGPNHKYERVFDNHLKEKKNTLSYQDSDGKPWININTKEDYYNAVDLHAALHKTLKEKYQNKITTKAVTSHHKNKKKNTTYYNHLMAEKIYTNMLKEIQTILTKHKIPYWLDWGTLLGAMRTGKMLPNDDDLDLGTLKTYISKRNTRKKLAKAFAQKGYTLTYYWDIITLTKNKHSIDISLMIEDPKNNQVIRQRYDTINKTALQLFKFRRLKTAEYYGNPQLGINRQAMKINLLWTLHHTPQMVKNVLFNTTNFLLNPYQKMDLYHLTMPLSGYKQLRTTPFYGINAPIPQQAETYLTKEYGDWKTPPKKNTPWIWREHGTHTKILSKP